MVMGFMPQQVDLAVVGGGVGGYFAAIRAAQLGMSVAIVEKDKLGGHCPNYACIPSKTLIKIGDIFYDAQHSQKFGINASATIDAKKMLEWRMGVSKKLEEGVAYLCKSNGIDVINASATFMSSNALQLTNGVKLEFKKAIIATGSEPAALQGFEFGSDVLDYKQALMLDYIPKSLVIVGAGYVAVELGTLFAKLGTAVHIIARSDVLRAFDKDAVLIVTKRMQELGIAIHSDATPVAHGNGTVTLSNGEKIDADTIVVAIGLLPYTQGLELDNTKVRLDGKGFIKVDSALRTSDPNILAVGDVIGEPMLAHKAMRQGIVAAEVASGTNTAYDNIVVPAVIFSDPEVAIAGSIEESDGIKVTRFPMTAIGRAIALDTTKGFVKMAYDGNNVIKGVEIVSDDASAMISEAALAIEMGATLEDVADTIHPHPTYSESLQEVAEAALGRPIHFFYGPQHK